MGAEVLNFLLLDTLQMEQNAVWYRVNAVLEAFVMAIDLTGR